MRILLTGSHGYVGSALRNRLIRDGHDLFCVDTQWFLQDAIVPKDVRNLLHVEPVEVIIHLAAISNDPSVSHYPRLSWETSVLATMRLAEMALKAGARFIYASSVSVYGANRGLVKETDELHPLSDYNKTKMAAERVLMSYPGLPVQIIRPATICGISPRMRLDLTVNMLTMQALTKGVMTLHGGQQMRPSIHLDDMVELYVWMLEHPDVLGVFNAGFENHTLLQLAEEVAWLVKPARIEITEQRDIRSYQVNSDKLLAAGFRPRKSALHAIQELMIAHDLEQTNWQNTVNLTAMQALGIRDDMPDVSIDAVRRVPA